MSGSGSVNLQTSIAQDLTQLLNQQENYTFNPPKKPDLVLHLDVNGTLNLKDGATNKGADEMINQALAKRIVDLWPGCQKPKSFFDYVYQDLVPGSINSKELKPERTNRVINFISYLKDKQIPYAELADKLRNKALETLSRMKKEDKEIVPSFYHTVQVLKQQEFSFSVNLRSFGIETQDTAKEIEKYASITFTKLLPINPEFHITNLAAQFRALNIPVKDDWDTWNKHGEKAEYGKVFPVETSEKTLSMFYDDNANPPGDNVKEIISPRDPETGKNLDPAPLFQKGIIVKADALEALLDKNYFLKRIEQAIRSVFA